MLSDGDQLIVGSNWLSRSRITYVVKGNQADAVRTFIGETAVLTGQVVDLSPWHKELWVSAIEASPEPNALSMRIGYVKEIGPSIYMQGTHMLAHREGEPICLLDGRQAGIDLDAYSAARVAVYGIMSRTVEGDAQIMEVRLVEIAK